MYIYIILKRKEVGKFSDTCLLKVSKLLSDRMDERNEIKTGEAINLPRWVPRLILFN